jgi:hypothetical protein
MTEHMRYVNLTLKMA